jgi:hypothetical protein
VEHVYHEIDEIEQDPPSLCQAFHVVWPASFVIQPLEGVVRHRAHVGVGRSRRDHEEVGRVAQPAKIQNRDVLGLEVGQRLRRAPRVARGGLSLPSGPVPDLFLSTDGGALR